MDGQIKGTQFEKELDVIFSIRMNSKPMSRGVWNLILSKRDCNLFAKGIKPHRLWRLKDVKLYFGITGGAKNCAEQLEQYLEILTVENQIETNE